MITPGVTSLCRETNSLLILHAEDTRQQMISQPAFAGPADLQACLERRFSMIAKEHFQVVPTGFEVIARPVLPLPDALLNTIRDAY